jgi:hypothetical protein
MADVPQLETETDFAVSDIYKSGRNLSNSQLSQIEDLRGEYREYEENIRTSIESGDYESVELKDTVYLTLELKSPREIRDAYSLVTIRYNSPNPSHPGGRQHLSIARVRRGGHLSEGKSEKVKLNFRVPAGYLEEARYHTNVP